MSGPLEGIRVIEIGALIAAPFAARLMAEFGAEVIKIESPGGGDPLRRWRKLHEGTSLWWYLQSRNKQSVCIDLKSEEGVEIVKRLAAQADVVIENLRPGGLERLGLGWDVLHALNPPAHDGADLGLWPDRPPTAIARVSARSARRWAASATRPARPAARPRGSASAWATRSPRCTA